MKVSGNASAACEGGPALLNSRPLNEVVLLKCGVELTHLCNSSQKRSPFLSFHLTCTKTCIIGGVDLAPTSGQMRINHLTSISCSELLRSTDIFVFVSLQTATFWSGGDSKSCFDVMVSWWMCCSDWGKSQDKPDHMSGVRTLTNTAALPKVHGLFKATFAKAPGSDWGHFLKKRTDCSPTEAK